MQIPPAQVSPKVQTLLSVHEAVLLAFMQPVLGSQVSSVHTLLSSHFFCPPGTQAPPLQVSLRVQRLLSVQGAALLLWVQPLSPAQASSVQGLPSPQSSLPAALHAPPLQMSPVEQASPSSQGRVLAAVVQPDLGSQPSVVQSLLSSHTLATPGRQSPLLQASLTVQMLPSLHEAVLST